MQKVNIYVVIVTYNAMPWLDKCLGSINFSKYNVVVVDNNSKDETVEHIRTNYTEVKLFQERENLGFGQGNNKGVSYAMDQDAEHIFLLNQDAYLIDDALEQLVEFQKNNPEYGIISPIHTNYECNQLDPSFSKYMRHENNPAFFSDYVLGNELKPIYDVIFVNAAGWLINRKCLNTVGGFDPIFFHYGEDINFCQRVLFHNFKIGVLADSFMAHHHTHTNKKAEKVNISLNQFCNNYEKALKVKYADIRNNISIDDEWKKILKKLIISVIILNFKNMTRMVHSLRIIKKIKPHINESRKINQIKGVKYLNRN